jgi:hypothetical protein
MFNGRIQEHICNTRCAIIGMAVGAAITKKSEAVKALTMLNTLAPRWLKLIGWDIGEKEKSGIKRIQTDNAKEFLQGQFAPLHDFRECTGPELIVCS